MAFFNTAETLPLFAGVTNSTASAASTCARSLATGGGG